MSPPAVMTGFFGKLPARGDFVRAGLPGAFIAAWDSWISAGLMGSRARMAGAWLDAWLEAPIWRFQLPAGQCGPLAVLGLWMPSVDAAGRYFPLTIAAVFSAGAAAVSPAWLDAVEAGGRAALERDAEPAGLAAMIPPFPAAEDGDPTPAAGARWWTDGGPRVPAASLSLAEMPTTAQFTAMLGGDAA